MSAGAFRYRSAFGASRRPASRERRVVVNARDDVEQRPLGRRRKAHAVGRDDRHVERRRQIDERLVVGFLVAAEVPLQLDVDAVAAEQADEAIEQAADAVARRVERRAAGERDEAAGRARPDRPASARLRLSARASSCG